MKIQNIIHDDFTKKQGKKRVSGGTLYTPVYSTETG